MKKVTSIILIVLILSLAACANQKNNLTDAGNAQSENITMPDEGVWPANDYTRGLPEPSGTVVWARLDNKYENCSINMTDMSEADYNNYLDLLKQDGFSVVEEVPEEIKGQNYVSIGTLMSDGERCLSISYIPNSFTIYISFKK